MSNELAELRNENTQLMQEIESRKQTVSKIEGKIHENDDKIAENDEKIQTLSASLQQQPPQKPPKPPKRVTDVSVQTSPMPPPRPVIDIAKIEKIEKEKQALETQNQTLENQKQVLEKEKQELLAANAKQTNELKENDEKIKKQSDQIHTLVVKQDNALREFNQKTAAFESELAKIKDQKTQQQAQEQLDQEKRAQKYKTLYFKQKTLYDKQVEETKQLKQQLTETPTTSSTRPTVPFLPTRAAEPLPKTYIHHITAFLEKCIKESYSIDRIIQIDDVRKEIRPLFHSESITPKQLIDLLNTNKAADELNRLLYVAITHKTTSMQRKYYVRHLASQSNINPKIQHTASGLTVLDLAASTPDDAYALLKNPLFDINNQYATGPLRSPYSRPVIEAIKSRNIPIATIILNDPRCNIHLKDSEGLSPLDYVFTIDRQRPSEPRNHLFRLLVHSNKARELREESIFKNGNIMDKLDRIMLDTLLREDPDLFEKQYSEYYKNNPEMMAKLAGYLSGGGRRRDTKRRRRSAGGGRKTRCGGQTGIFKGGSARKHKTKRGGGRSGIKRSKTKRRSIA